MKWEFSNLHNKNSADITEQKNGKYLFKGTVQPFE
jgi:hypothetical protein